MEYSLNMEFLTSGSKKVTFTVSGVKDTLTDAEANTLMDAIIAQNIFTTTSGDLVKKSAAHIVAKQSKEVTIA
jgi:hypothetical protein